MFAPAGARKRDRGPGVEFDMDLKVGSRPKNIENTLSTDNRNRPNLAIEGFGRSNPTSDLPEFRANSTKISGKFC